MTLIKLKEKEGEPDSVLLQLRALMLHFNKLVEDEGLVKQLWGKVCGFFFFLSSLFLLLFFLPLRFIYFFVIFMV